MKFRKYKIRKLTLPSNYPIYFIIPAIICYFLLFFIPMIVNSGFSFTDWHVARSFISFNGIDNFIEIAKTARILTIAKNTFVFAITLVMLQNLGGFILAMMLYQKSRLNEFFRAIFFAPAVLSVVAIGYIFSSILLQKGFLNRLLSIIFSRNIDIIWLGSTKFTIFIVVLVAVWQWSGFTMMIYIASINSIPVEIIESAKIDGVNYFQLIKNIIIPLIMTSLAVNIIIAIIGGLRVFDHIYVMTKGGPAKSTEVFNSAIFETYGYGRFGEGIAMNLVLMILVAIIALPVYTSLRKRFIEY